MTEPTCELQLCPNGRRILPVVRDYPPDDDGIVSHWLSLECGDSSVVISRLSLSEIRELARQINLQVDEAERKEWFAAHGGVVGIRSSEGRAAVAR